ncbi:MAG: hypothetical protein OXP73_10465 [Chloroflexota bacterium]|nr:hypothetical protein [Chloroflexota bacterium]
MTVDPAVAPGLLLLVLEFGGLAALGYVVARVALRQNGDSMALAQGMVIGPALWGLIANFMLHPAPGRAGALASWAVLLALAAVLVWRAPQPVRPRLRTAARFTIAALAVFWVMLAARQLLQIPDEAIHLGLSAYIREGGWPPAISWTPDQPLLYHYGADMLIGLLMTPGGPDLPFTTELVGAYAWTGLALVIATLLYKRGGWSSVAVLAPLVLTPGAWTLVGFIIPPPDILQIPSPTGLPAAGLGSSLANVYWPQVSLNWQTEFVASPPNIWKPPFIWAYALTLVVVTAVAGSRGQSWTATLILAALVGFVGLLSEEVALVVLACWIALEAARVASAIRLSPRSMRCRLAPTQRTEVACRAHSRDSEDLTQEPLEPDGPGKWSDGIESQAAILRIAAGPALAALLLAVGGGPISALLGGVSSGTHLGWIDEPGSRLPFGTLLTPGPGGIGRLGLGVIPVAAIALLLAWRQRLVLALVAGAGVFMLAAIALRHPAFPFDVTRMDGHARNFALLALLLALGWRLSALRPPWRYAAGALIVALVAWPTVAVPVRTLGLAVGHGIELVNAQSASRGRSNEFDTDRYFWGLGRYKIEHPVSEPVARFISDHTPVDARILSPNPLDMTATTGRPNASGFEEVLHLWANKGPAFEDARDFLEPAAVRRLGFAYLHATDGWVASLPDHARRWLNDPRFFAPLIRGDADALYRIQPAFLELDPEPDPASFEALRQAVPASASAYLAGGLTAKNQVRLATALAHTRLLGEVDPSGTYLLTEIPTEPVQGHTPSVLLAPRGFAFTTRAEEFSLIWLGDEVAVYATVPEISPVVDEPPPPEHDFSVGLSDVRVEGDRVSFTATFDDMARERWTGQDWLVLEVDETPWALPTRYEADGFTNVGRVWFAGQIVPARGIVTHEYEFSARERRLAVRVGDAMVPAQSSSAEALAPGAYVLAVRLRLAHLQAAVLPVLRTTISETGDVTYAIHRDTSSAAVNACPELLQHTESCRRLTAGAPGASP